MVQVSTIAPWQSYHTMSWTRGGKVAKLIRSLHGIEFMKLLSHSLCRAAPFSLQREFESWNSQLFHEVSAAVPFSPQRNSVLPTFLSAVQLHSLFLLSAVQLHSLLLAPSRGASQSPPRKRHRRTALSPSLSLYYLSLSVARRHFARAAQSRRRRPLLPAAQTICPLRARTPSPATAARCEHPIRPSLRNRSPPDLCRALSSALLASSPPRGGPYLLYFVINKIYKRMCSRCNFGLLYLKWRQCDLKPYIAQCSLGLAVTSSLHTPWHGQPGQGHTFRLRQGNTFCLVKSFRFRRLGFIYRR